MSLRESIEDYMIYKKFKSLLDPNEQGRLTILWDLIVELRSTLIPETLGGDGNLTVINRYINKKDSEEIARMIMSGNLGQACVLSKSIYLKCQHKRSNGVKQWHFDLDYHAKERRNGVVHISLRDHLEYLEFTNEEKLGFSTLGTLRNMSEKDFGWSGIETRQNLIMPEIRFHLENVFLPKKIFDEEFMSTLLKYGGSFLFSFVRDYCSDNEIDCLYTEDQYISKIINIDETYSMMKITFPEPEVTYLSSNIYLIYNNKFDDISYFAVQLKEIKENSKKVFELFKWNTDGKSYSCGEIPSAELEQEEFVKRVFSGLN